MVSIDIEIALVGLTAMLEPATLLASVLALVVGDRPLRPLRTRRARPTRCRALRGR